MLYKILSEWIIKMRHFKTKKSDFFLGKSKSEWGLVCSVLCPSPEKYMPFWFKNCTFGWFIRTVICTTFIAVYVTKQLLEGTFLFFPPASLTSTALVIRRGDRQTPHRRCFTITAMNADNVVIQVKRTYLPSGWRGRRSHEASTRHRRHARPVRRLNRVYAWPGR